MLTRSPLLLLPVLLLGCADPAPTTPAPTNTPSTQAPPVKSAGLPDRDIPLAKKLIAEGAVLLDVRTPDEFAGGHIAGAKLIPVQTLGARMVDIKELTGGDREKPIVVYCASGGRSGQAKQMLLKAGYTQVTNAGGYSDLK